MSEEIGAVLVTTKLNIGAVTFWHKGRRPDYKNGEESPIGDQRVELLKLAFQRKLPEDWELRADWYHQERKLEWEDVNWNTSGIPAMLCDVHDWIVLAGSSPNVRLWQCRKCNDGRVDINPNKHQIGMPR
jgi:hypothetical protein